MRRGVRWAGRLPFTRTRRARAEASESRADQLLAATFDESPVATLRAHREGDRVGRILDANPAAGRILGRSPRRLEGSQLHRLLAGHERLPVFDEPRTVDVRVKGSNRWLSATVTALSSAAGDDVALVVLVDVTQRRTDDEQLSRAAHHDVLTGLMNRDELLRRMAALQPETPKEHVALMFLDLDGFKAVNDAHGHHIGDELLVAVARRIRRAIRPGDFVGRIGGDEFVIVCPHLEEPSVARALAERVRATLDEPVSIEGLELRISMSVGIAESLAESIDGPQLLRQADMAMYRAKEAGRNAIRFYAPQMDVDALVAERTGQELRYALDDEGLVLHFHPIVEIATGRVQYVEALVRIRSRSGFLLHPGTFMPVAARRGLLDRLGGKALHQALAQRARWVSEGLVVPVALNLTSGLLPSPAMAEGVARIVAREGHEPGAVMIEVGEAIVGAAPEAAVQGFALLRAAGIGTVLDHFGAGGSLLGVLRNLPVDRVKLDRLLVGRMTHSTADRAIVGAVVEVCHALGIRVVAEGVERPEQVAELARLGCDEAQGFFICQTGPADALDLPNLRWEAGTLSRLWQ